MDIRRDKQQAALGLPHFPTTTIGSFPQTKEVRAALGQALPRWLASAVTLAERRLASSSCIALETRRRSIRVQEETGIDVLVRGECERNDMVEYFGEQLSGFTATTNGWVR